MIFVWRRQRCSLVSCGWVAVAYMYNIYYAYIYIYIYCIPAVRWLGAFYISYETFCTAYFHRRYYIYRGTYGTFIFFLHTLSKAVNFISAFYHLKGTERRMKLTLLPPPHLSRRIHIYIYIKYMYTLFFSPRRRCVLLL